MFQPAGYMILTDINTKRGREREREIVVAQGARLSSGSGPKSEAKAKNN